MKIEDEKLIQRKRYKRIRLLRTVFAYGLHIWVIVFVANILLLYSVRFYTHGTVCMNRLQVAADNRCLYILGNRVFSKGIVSSLHPQPDCGSDLTRALPASIVSDPAKYIVPNFVSDLCQADIASSVQSSLSPQPSPSTIPSDTPYPTDTPEPTATPTPAGPVLGLTFSVPGIGSGGGNLQPLHPTRNVTIYLYPPQLNAFDATVKPLYVIRTQAFFDPDPNSPTYTSFLNQAIDLGAQVPDGQYQVVFKTDQTLRKLIKTKEDDVGGEVFSLGRNLPVIANPQTMIPGDIFPHPDGDNVMDINDYNALVNCFENRTVHTKCPSKEAADLDDNGVVDGIDYNLMVLSFKSLLALGFPVPTLTVPPTPSPTVIRPTAKPQPTKAVQPKPTSAVASKSSKGGGLLGFLLFILLVIGVAAGAFFIRKKLMGGMRGPAPAQEEAPQTPEQEQQIEQVPALPQAQEAPAEAPVAQNDDGSKEYYVKKKSSDENGTWLSMTDDNGQLDGLYKGSEVLEGFVKVKGTMTTENGKTYMLVTEIRPID